MASLVEELKLLELPAPSKIDVEDLNYDLTAAKVISRQDLEYDEVTNNAGESSLRKKTAVSLAATDKRYAGQKISRKDLSKLRANLNEDEADSLQGDIVGSESLSGSHSDSEESIISNEIDKFRQSGSDESRNEDGNHSASDENEDSRGNLEESEPENEEDDEEDEDAMQTFSTPDTNELQKGKAVVQQIGLWDSFLENRIRLQKSLVQINKLPQHDVFKEFQEKGASQLKEPLNNAQQLLMNLLHNLMVLQQVLLERNTETRGILEPEKSGKNKQSDSDEDIPSDFEDEDGNANERIDKEVAGAVEDNDEESNDDNDSHVDDASGILILPKKRKCSMKLDDYSWNIAKRHAAFEHFRDGTIKKWNEKTRLASGKVNNKSFSSFDRSTLSQIRQILSDKERLVKRTQLKRSSYRVLGKPEDHDSREMAEQRDAHLKDYDTEIFDDDDFYHQLLREFIERKSNVDSDDPIALGRQWLEIQRLRSKVKRKVDTKASKGRRLRYDVHTKLVSFMAPQMRGTMSDSSRNELFSSLFGKRQPTEPADIALFK